MAKRDSPRMLTLKVDKYNLDEECEQLPDDYGYWAGLMVKAKDRVARAKAELKLTEAELGLAIRKNPGKYGFPGKPTDKAVEARILTCLEYQTALSEFNDAVYEHDQYEVGVNGLNHKRPMIEQLSFHHAQGYFSKPSERPRGIKKREKRE